MIVFYIYHQSTGELVRRDAGNPEYVMYDIQEGEDFTLTPPPDMESNWVWSGLEWVEVKTE